MTASAEHVEWETPPVEAAEDDSGLGAAVLPEFSDAAGIETLEEPPRRGRKPRADSVATAEGAGPVFDRRMMAHLLAQIDNTVSILAGIQREEEEYINGVADTVLPLANYYAAKSESVVGMWIAAGLGLLSFAVVKYQRFRERLYNEEVKKAA